MTTNEIEHLGMRWAAAEVRGDTDELAAMITDDFTMVGPLGFVLDREQWLGRHTSGDLVTEQLNWVDVQVRVLGATAISIGTQEQQVKHKGSAVNGKLRITHVFVRGDDGQWRIAGLHMSPVFGEPPFGQLGRPA
ncbi:MAG: nuclear transport factor 2 family protein [Thermocrispum sp.]